MPKLKIDQHPDVKSKLAKYPAAVRPKLKHLRKLVIETAEELGIDQIEETLKWGEISYLAKKGSTIRMDWKAKAPDQYAMYFKCTSKLVLNFKEVYGDTFKYEKTRALVFNLDEDPPKKELKACIAAALQYHNVKQLPHLGLSK